MAIRINNPTRWTAEELSILKEAYPLFKIADVCLYFLPRRSYVSVMVKARRLNLDHTDPCIRKRSPEFKALISEIKTEYYKTHSAPFKGKHLSEQTISILKELAIKQFSDPNQRERVSIQQKLIYKDPTKREERRLFATAQFQDPAFLKKWHKSLLKKTKPEIRIENILISSGLPFSYNGDFSQGVLLKGMIPDFININGKKQVIEVFGDYWHTKKVRKANQTEEGRKQAYKELGFDCLVLWESEINKKDDSELKNKILEFNGGVHCLAISLR